MKTFNIFVIGILLCSVFVIADSTRATTYVTNFSQSWDYEQYTVHQVLTDTSIVQLSAQKLYGSIHNHQAILATNDAELIMLNTNTGDIEYTGITLPTRRSCLGCATSIGAQPYPYTYIYQDDYLIVKSDGTWGAYHIPSKTTYTLSIPDDENNYHVYVTDENEIVAVAPTIGDLIVDRTGMDPYYVLQLDGTYTYAESEEPPVVQQEQEVNNAYYPYLITTDQHDDMLIGQIEESVYISKDTNIMRIGYTGKTLNGYYSTVSFTSDAPMLAGNDRAFWIGADDNIYIAHIDNVEQSDIIDIPTNYAFRSMSNPTVYYRHSTPTGLVKFDKAEDYFLHTERFHDIYDTSFTRVLMLADDVVNTYLEQRTKPEVPSYDPYSGY